MCGDQGDTASCFLNRNSYIYRSKSCLISHIQQLIILTKFKNNPTTTDNYYNMMFSAQQTSLFAVLVFLAGFTIAAPTGDQSSGVNVGQFRTVTASLS
jgi:hypothetical protein